MQMNEIYIRRSFMLHKGNWYDWGMQGERGFNGVCLLFSAFSIISKFAIAVEISTRK